MNENRIVLPWKNSSLIVALKNINQILSVYLYLLLCSLRGELSVWIMTCLHFKEHPNGHIPSSVEMLADFWRRYLFICVVYWSTVWLIHHLRRFWAKCTANVSRCNDIEIGCESGPLSLLMKNINFTMTGQNIYIYFSSSLSLKPDLRWDNFNEFSRIALNVL